MTWGAPDKVTCAGCGTLVPRRGNRKKWCAECLKGRKRISDRAYTALHRVEARARAREWADQHPERVRGRYRREKERDPAALALMLKRRYAREAEKRRAYARKWYARNRERVLARMSTPEGRQYSRDRMRNKLAEDPRFKIDQSISRAIRASIRNKGRRRWEILVGYSLAELCQHLERQFRGGMSWANYGKPDGCWHIDHIVPLSSFSYTSASDTEFCACWALTNLRPLWSSANLKKSGRREHLL